jgi:hypothetical protein
MVFNNSKSNQKKGIMLLSIRLTVTKKGKETPYVRSLPQSWEDVIAGKYNPVGTLRTLLSQSEASAKLSILRGWLRLPKSVFNALSNNIVEDLTATLHWLRPDALTVPLMTDFAHKGVQYFFPKPNFENGSALEFALSDNYFKKVAESNDPEALLKLVATLCRPAQTDTKIAIQSGDVRVELVSRPEVEHRALSLVGLDETVQMSVFLYFAAVKKYIGDVYGKHLFEQKEGEENENEGEENAPSQNAEPLGWWGIFMEMAENPINLPKIHATNFHSLCVWLVRNKILGDRMRALVTKPTFKENQEF